jgi:hypothetical protein
MAPVIFTLEMLHQHVLELAADLRIAWIDNGWTPAANHETRIVALHAIKSEDAYAVALHEIGHIRNGRFDNILIEERRAWEWARDNALVWTPTMQREADVSARSYELAVDEHEDAQLTDFYYDQILALVRNLLRGEPYGELMYNALVRNTAELAEMYEGYDQKEARRVLIQLIDKYLPAAEQNDPDAELGNKEGVKI